MPRGSDGSGESRTQPGRRRQRIVRRRARRARVLRDEWASALPEVEVPLGRELRVRLDDDSSRHTQLDGETARGRQLRPAAQRAVADRAPKLILDLRGKRSRSASHHRDQQIDGLTGLFHVCPQRVYTCTSGPYHRATATVDHAAAGCMPCSPAGSPSVRARSIVMSAAAMPAPPARTKAADGPE